MDVLCQLMLFKDLEKGQKLLRISEDCIDPTMATDLLESNLKKLNRLMQAGGLSFEKYEMAGRELLT